LLARDAIDSTRKHAPLRKADGALEIDSTFMTLDEVIQTVINALPEEWKIKS
jgi:cytidylate kinase